MKKIILILLLAISSLPLHSNAADNNNKPSYLVPHLKKIACVTAGVISLAAIVPALISDLKAARGTAQAEIPLVTVPLSALILSCLAYSQI
jgi:hypothetical protein